MWEFIQWCAIQTEHTYNCINSISFNIGGVTVGYADLFLGMIGVGMVVSLFWKGARG